MFGCSAPCPHARLCPIIESISTVGLEKEALGLKLLPLCHSGVLANPNGMVRLIGGGPIAWKPICVMSNVTFSPFPPPPSIF